MHPRLEDEIFLRLDGGEMEILAALAIAWRTRAGGGWSSAAEIAWAMRLPPEVASTFIERLEARGLVERRRAGEEELFRLQRARVKALAPLAASRIWG